MKRTQKCLQCRKRLQVVDDEGRVERHLDESKKLCEGSYYPATWHSRQLEFLEMMQQLNGGRSSAG